MKTTSSADEVGRWTGIAPQIGRVDMAGRETILVADDDAAILQLLELMLEEAGYDVVKASDGQEALELIRVRRPDLVLIDFMMPNLDGCSVCERLKSAEDTRCLPVVIMSADRDVAERACEASADGYVLKPFNLEEILDCVHGYLDGSDKGCELS